MKLNSKYLEGLRIRADAKATASEDAPLCEWPGCRAEAEHPAPKGRDREGEYFLFCMEHVRQYNKRYNYFSGMADEELREWLERNITGHRPTWRMGGHAPGPGGLHPDLLKARAAFRPGMSWRDAHGLFGHAAQSRQPPPRRRRLPPAVAEALCTLGLDEEADATLIKARYKKLVKELHPDMHGGDKSREARLREVIAAYHKLRKAKLV